MILGGVGFIGRNLVHHLVKSDLCAKIRVIDKVLPATAFLSAEHAASFENPVVEYKQASLTQAAAVEKAFTLEEGKFNYVFNLAAETKYGQTDEVYEQKVFDVVVKVGDAAKKHGVDKFVELSTAQVYQPHSKKSKEDAKIEPWTALAKYKYRCEQHLASIAGLPLVILRASTVYGPGDSTGIMPRIITAAVYKHINERMKFLWSGDLKMNTVHVFDVVKAMWHSATTLPAGSIYNLADKNDTDQEAINVFLEKIFNIKTGFHGSMLSNVAKLKLKEVTEVANDKHLKPWSDLCKEAGIANTPLTPYIDQELFYNNALSIDGSAIEASGFTYDHPKITEDAIRVSIQYFVDQNVYPRTVL